MDARTGLQVRLRRAAPFALDVEFEAPAGAITALFGPSGSGKSTVLRAIAGLQSMDVARVACGGATWTDTAAGLATPPHRRPVGFVFQDYALFPHLTVREQLALSLGHRPAAERPARIDSLLQLVHLEELGDRRPAALSGGQQQRAALARALARDPAVLLLDEPFAAVDWALREALRRELVRLQRALSLTIVLVTHDFEDVAKLASHLVVLEGGVVTASGAVESLTGRNAVPGVSGLREPAVALDARVEAHERERQLTVIAAGDLRLEVPAIAVSVGAPVRIQLAAREVILASRRPEGLSLHNVVEAEVVAVEQASHEALRLVHLRVGDTRVLSLVTVDAERKLELAPGKPVLALVKAVAIEAFA
jgi:molybdate transport system ATP-binding protein